jgi:hypothetical protein
MSEEAILMMERWKFCYETKQLLINTDYAESPDYNKQPIIIKKKILQLLQEQFGVSYSQATIDYRRAEEIFEMTFIDNSYIKYDILENNANELFALALESGDLGTAKDLLKIQKKSLKNVLRKSLELIQVDQK